MRGAARVGEVSMMWQRGLDVILLDGAPRPGWPGCRPFRLSVL
jgi:hypothetical protein